MIAYVIPTRNRPDALATTLAHVAALGPHEAEVIVLDNASTPRITAPRRLASGLPVRLHRLSTNIAAAARNLAITLADPASRWFVMLDDDSAPLSLDFLHALRTAPPQLAALSADIFHPAPPGARAVREQGGLPEVPIGCGVALRAEAFARVNGYDPSFHYYAEEYDLAAKLIAAGYILRFDPSFRVLHRRDASNRRFATIARNLVRNNAVVTLRYAPDEVLHAELFRHLTRYARIAAREHALRGYLRGMVELLPTLPRQQRMPLTGAQWDRFTGRMACETHLRRTLRGLDHTRAALIAPGKNAHILIELLESLRVEIVSDPRDADVRVIATLSPGPMLDALAANPGAITPWSPERAVCVASEPLQARSA